MRAPLIALALLASTSSAFPAYLNELPPDDAAKIKRAISYDSPYPDVRGLVKIPDADHPYADPVKGGPGVGDQRGPCPGLNVLANHGYIPRSGIATLSQLVSSMEVAFNLSPELGTVLSAISVVLSGNPLTMTVSIGGPDPRVDRSGTIAQQEAFAEMFGSAAGCDGHNSFEADGSLSRKDFFLNHGDAYNWEAEPYQVLSDVGLFNGDDYGLDTTHEVHYRRWLHSKTNNPAWYNMPPSALLTTGAASFVGRCYANGTYGAGGVTNAASVDPFFGAIPLNKDRTKFGWVPEKFPEEWFRSGVAYGTKEVLVDILQTYANHPEMMVYGGNAGRTGNFVPLGLNAPTDVDGLACFLYNAQMALLPSQLSGATVAGITLAQTTLNALIGPIFTGTFGCGDYAPKPEFNGKFENFTRAYEAGLRENGLATGVRGKEGEMKGPKVGKRRLDE